MPLIQTVVAEQYGRPTAEVRVGFQSLDKNALIDVTYVEAARIEALTEFKSIGDQVFKFWPKPRDRPHYF